MTSESSSMTMKSDNESKLVNTATNSNNSSNVNNFKIYLNCTSSSSNSNSNKSTAANSLNSAITTEAVAVATATITTTSTATSDLPTITLAPFSKIKRETDSSDHSHTRHSSSMITKSNISSGTSTSNSNSINISSSSSTSTSTNNSSSSNCNSQVPVVNPNSVSAKMGSRRIFTPQFKLQVLESYRNDSDCKGNQRATARKYNIHRRQIQKWLQCESNLRSSVANISANNVKHQFHNITHQMPIVTTSTLPSSASSSIHTNNNNNNNNLHHHHHAHHNQQQYKAINRLSLDTTRHSVALTSMPIATSKPSSGVLAAAAANIRDVGAVAPLSSPSSSSTSFLSSSTVKSLHAPTSPILHSQILSKSNVITVSPSALQCTKGRQMIGGPAAVPVLTPSLHSAYHHESMGIHTPPALLTSVPVSVPIITPHPHTHLHVANLKNHYQHHHLHHHLHMEEHQHQQQLNQHHHQQHLQQHHPHHHHHHHPHHHHPYNQVPQPPPPPPQQQQQSALSSERRPFVPSASLPVLPTSTFSSSSSSLSSSSSSSTTAPSPPAPTMTAVALSCTDTSEPTPAAALSLVQVEENPIDELRDYQTTTTTTTTTSLSSSSSSSSSTSAAAVAALVTENRYDYTRMNENEFALSRTQQLHRAFEDFQYYMPLPLHMHPATTTAMIAPMDLSLGPKRYSLAFDENSNNTTAHKSDLSPKDNQHEDDDNDNEDSQLNVVDTDYSESQGVDLTLRKRRVHMSSVAETVSAEKQTKLSSDDRDEKDPDKPHEPVKTFKLFKPYLLGEDDSTSTDTDKETADKISKQKDPIIWSHHTACLSPPISRESHQCSSRGSNFQSPPADAYPFPAGSPNFQPTPPTATTSSFRCPKGSPVSGYESSSSIYSDSALSSNGDHNNSTTHPHTTYSFDLKVHNINGGDLSNRHLIPAAAGRPFISDGCIPFPPTTINHVQRWLDQESGIRPSIALYV